MSIINNWDVYTQRNWDSKGREKLIKAFDKIVEDFPETDVGSQIFNSISSLSNQVAQLNIVSPQYYGTAVDIPLTDSGNTDINLGIGFAMGNTFLDRKILFHGQILITTVETSWGLHINSSVPLSGGGGFSRIIDFTTGATIADDNGSGAPSILVSGLSTTQVIWDFSFVAVIDANTTFSLRATDVGGVMNQGSWVKAVHIDGDPVPIPL